MDMMNTIAITIYVVQKLLAGPNPQILLLLSPDCIEFGLLLSPIGDVPTNTHPENLTLASLYQIGDVPAYTLHNLCILFKKFQLIHPLKILHGHLCKPDDHQEKHYSE